MFDIAFSELLVIAVVALVVIGPEKLPKVARTVGLLLGRAQRYVNGVKSDISRELRFEELQRLQADVRDAEAVFKQAGSDVEQQIQQIQIASSEMEPQQAPSVTPAPVNQDVANQSSQHGRPD